MLSAIMVDLHTHSTASDGQYTPKELVRRAFNMGISALALTDHDTTAGIAEASCAAATTGLTFIPGVELNIQWPTGEFHLLGLGLKKISHSLDNVAFNLRSARRTRNILILEKLRQEGFSISIEDVEHMYPKQTIGRPHIAGYLVQNGFVESRQKAFDMYLARDRPCYVEMQGADLEKAVAAINDSGGVSVIAHPLSLYISLNKIETTLRDIYSRGVAGLEAWHPGSRVSECYRLEEIARKIGFFITAGSDFHGENVRAGRKLGRTAGGREIADRYFIEELFPRLQMEHY